MTASIDYLPIWKKDAPTHVRLYELAEIARKHPARFAKWVIVYCEYPEGGLWCAQCQVMRRLHPMPSAFFRPAYSASGTRRRLSDWLDWVSPTPRALDRLLAPLNDDCYWR